MKPPIKGLADATERTELRLDAPVSPTPPSGSSDAGVTQDWCHLKPRRGGAVFYGSDLWVNHGAEYVHDCTVIASTNAAFQTHGSVQCADMADVGDQARALLRRALDETGLSPYALARKAGVAPTTITRPLNNPEFKFTPKQATLNKIAEAAGLTPPSVVEPLATVEAVTQWVPLIGEVRAGSWTEIPDEPVVEDRIPVYLPEYQRATLFAVRVAGRSMDLKYADGEVVIVVPAIESGVRVGDDVVVRRRNGQLTETTLKEVVQEPDGSFSLHPRSTDLTLKPLPIPRGEDCDQGVEIIGVVIYSMSPRRHGRGPLVTLD